MEHALRLYRKKHGLTLAALGQALGVSKGFLSKIESGRQAPSIKLAAEISRVTAGAVTPNDFMRSSAEDLGRPAQCLERLGVKAEGDAA